MAEVPVIRKRILENSHFPEIQSYKDIYRIGDEIVLHGHHVFPEDDDEWEDYFTISVDEYLNAVRAAIVGQPTVFTKEGDTLKISFEDGEINFRFNVYHSPSSSSSTIIVGSNIDELLDVG